MHDVIIIGSGPAGLSAAIYAGRYKLKTLIITKMLGGAMTGAHIIENYPGIEHISGMEIAEKMKAQAEHLGAEIKEEAVTRLERKEKNFIVNQKYESRYLVIAMGTERRKLKVPREDEFIGRGLSYCATCDAPFYKDRIAAVVGGSDSAIMAADLLTIYAKKVYIIYRGDRLKGQPVAAERLLRNPKIETIFTASVTELHGAKKLESVTLDNGRRLDVDGLFVEIGSIPSSEHAREMGVKLDEDGCIIVDANMRTNVERAYSAGDITSHNAKWRQIVIACAEGALASRSIYEDFRKTRTDEYT
jgi:thioredoxin reductase (NADPH)